MVHGSYQRLEELGCGLGEGRGNDEVGARGGRYWWDAARLAIELAAPFGTEALVLAVLASLCLADGAGLRNELKLPAAPKPCRLLSASSRDRRYTRWWASSAVNSAASAGGMRPVATAACTVPGSRRSRRSCRELHFCREPPTSPPVPPPPWVRVAAASIRSSCEEDRSTLKTRDGNS
mmetsp:Transcript_9472/g.18623  ORF Transcript_9472/g.18623 Transcript_9472/m.18623 type:complete len:178 (+) Transcript_9472:78-611(+)